MALQKAGMSVRSTRPCSAKTANSHSLRPCAIGNISKAVVTSAGVIFCKSATAKSTCLLRPRVGQIPGQQIRSTARTCATPAFVSHERLSGQRIAGGRRSSAVMGERSLT